MEPTAAEHGNGAFPKKNQFKWGNFLARKVRKIKIILIITE
jgi:hypothetical protein